MSEITRRGVVRGALGTLASEQAIRRSASATPKAPGQPGIQLAFMLAPGQRDRQRLAKQMGVNHAIISVSRELSRARREDYSSVLQRIKDEYTDAGLSIAGVESHPVPAEKIKLGLAGRDEEIENYRWAIEALGKAGIPMVCYNFMAGLGWYRTSMKTPGRGGALVSEFDYEVSQRQGLTEWGEVSEERIWSNIEYFLKAIVPVAEKAGIKMALHPDDPPISPLRGIGRILTSAVNYRRVMDMVPSPINGVTYCQANFKAMGEDIEALARQWCREKKIFFVHFRDIEGDKRHFVETFHDNGPTDMARMMKVYHDSGFRGPMRLDHAPTMEGESNEHPGYMVLGRIYAIGYMKGLLDGQRIPYE